MKIMNHDSSPTASDAAWNRRHKALDIAMQDEDDEIEAGCGQTVVACAR